MNYIDELKRINQTQFKIADYKRCRTLGHGVYYEWVPIFVIAMQFGWVNFLSHYS